MADELLTTDEEILNSIGEGDITNAESTEQQPTEEATENTASSQEANVQSVGEDGGAGATGEGGSSQPNKTSLTNKEMLLPGEVKSVDSTKLLKENDKEQTISKKNRKNSAQKSKRTKEQTT